MQRYRASSTVRRGNAVTNKLARQVARRGPPVEWGSELRGLEACGLGTAMPLRSP